MTPGQSAGTGTSLFTQLIPLILIFGIFWVLIIRPQQKRTKAHRRLVEELAAGDEVIMDSGLHGTIRQIKEREVSLEVAPRVVLRFARSRVSERTRKGAAAKAETTAKEESSKSRARRKTKN